MKSTKPNYAIVYSYEEEDYGGPGGCNPSWTEWKVIPFETFHEMEKYIEERPAIKNWNNFTIMGAL